MTALDIALHRDLGRSIKVRRRSLSLSQQQLADIVGLTRSSIANIESGRQRITVQTLYDLSRGLRTIPSSLLPNVQNPTRKGTVSLKQILPDGTPKEIEFLKGILTRKGFSHDSKSELEETKANSRASGKNRRDKTATRSG